MLIGAKIIGPNIEEIPNTIEYIAMALDKRFGFTNEGSIADLEGRSKDKKIPVIKDSFDGIGWGYLWKFWQCFAYDTKSVFKLFFGHQSAIFTNITILSP